MGQSRHDEDRRFMEGWKDNGEDGPRTNETQCPDEMEGGGEWMERRIHTVSSDIDRCSTIYLNNSPGAY